MDRKHTVKKNKDFNSIIKKGFYQRHPFFTIYKKRNVDIDNYRFGISISKKLGNAVLRNKAKRQMRVIIDYYKDNYQKDDEYIIIIRKDFIEADFETKKVAFGDLINKLSRRNHEK